MGAKFADPTVPNTGLAQEYGYCVPNGTDVMPKHADFYGWTCDTRRGVLYAVPGLNETTVAEGNCTGETSTTQHSDPQYLYRRVMSFNPLTRTYADLAGGGVLSTDISAPPWGAQYDAILDRIIRLEGNGFGVGDRLWDERFDPTTNSWNYIPLNSPGNMAWQTTMWGLDRQRQVIYACDRRTGSFIRYQYLLGNAGLQVLGQLPGNAPYPDQGSSRAGDGGICVVDTNAGLVVYVELGVQLLGGPHTIRVWTLDRDFTPPYSPSLWTQIDTNSKVMLDGSPVGSFWPTCGPGQIAFDPDNNLVLLDGDQAGGADNVPQRYWAIRLSAMGVSSTSTINPVPLLDHITPASCTQGDTVSVTCVGLNSTFVQTSVVQWDGVAQPTTFVDANTLTFTVTATLSGVLGPHNVTVFSPTPGGGTSLATIFTVNPPSVPAPTLTLLTPSSTPFNSGTGCTITGANFISTSVVNWDGAVQPTTVVNSTTIIFSVTGALASVLGPHSVTVTTPPPGGGTSNSLTFTVTPVPTPTQTGIFVSSIM